MAQAGTGNRTLVVSYCAAFVAAGVLANLLVKEYGQAALPFTAVLLIPLELVARDVLHEYWSGKGLVLKMAALILFAALATACVNWGASRIALASFVGFTLAASSDALAFHCLRARSRYVRMNASNCVGACVDSLVFPAIAFGVKAMSLELCLYQAASKAIGGAGWTMVYVKLLNRRTSSDHLH